MTLKNTLYIVLITLVLTACEDNQLLVDTAGIQVNVEFENVNEIIFESDSIKLMSAYHSIEKNESSIFAYQIGQVLKIGRVSDTAFYNAISAFRSDNSINALEKDLERIIPLLEKKEENIIKGFEYIRYHFPDGLIPTKIAYLNGLFSTGVFSSEKEIGVGSEWYLGDTSKIVQQLNPQYFYDWMKSAMKIEFYERDILTSWIETHYVNPVEGNLAENMIRWGKVLYLVEAAFPEMDQRRIVRYTKESYDYALNNEEAFWNYLVNEDLLFKIDERTTRNMISEGPFTPGLPNQEAPDRYGQFLGWRMVHQFMKKTETPVAKLIDVEYNDILREYEIED